MKHFTINTIWCPESYSMRSCNFILFRNIYGYFLRLKFAFFSLFKKQHGATLNYIIWMRKRKQTKMLSSYIFLFPMKRSFWFEAIKCFVNYLKLRLVHQKPLPPTIAQFGKLHFATLHNNKTSSIITDKRYYKYRSFAVTVEPLHNGHLRTTNSGPNFTNNS